MNYLTAQIATIEIVPGFPIEGLYAGEWNGYYVAVSQIADRFQFVKTNAQRNVKALMGKGFQFVKLRTKLNPKAVNALTLWVPSQEKPYRE